MSGEPAAYGHKVLVSGDLVSEFRFHEEMRKFYERAINDMCLDMLGKVRYGPPEPPKYGPPEPDWCSECGETPYPRPQMKVPPHLAMQELT